MNGFFIFKSLKSPEKKKRRSPRTFISKQLDFSPSQLEQYKTIEQAHRERMDRIYGDTKQLKDALYSRLHDQQVNEKQIDSITTLLGEKEKEKDTEIFNYFRSISSFCNEDQKLQLSKMLKKARRRGRGGPPRPSKRKKP